MSCCGKPYRACFENEHRSFDYLDSVRTASNNSMHMHL